MNQPSRPTHTHRSVAVHRAARRTERAGFRAGTACGAFLLALLFSAGAAASQADALPGPDRSGLLSAANTHVVHFTHSGILTSLLTATVALGRAEEAGELLNALASSSAERPMASYHPAPLDDVAGALVRSIALSAPDDATGQRLRSRLAAVLLLSAYEDQQLRAVVDTLARLTSTMRGHDDRTWLFGVALWSEVHADSLRRLDPRVQIPLLELLFEAEAVRQLAAVIAPPPSGGRMDFVANYRRALPVSGEAPQGGIRSTAAGGLYWE